MERTLVLYVFHEIHARVHYFIKHAVFFSPSVDFVFIVNNERLDVRQCNIPSYVRVLQRPNIGFDFGGWTYALENMSSSERSSYTYFIFVNSSVLGPFLHMNTKGNWTDVYINKLNSHKNLKLIGSTINTIHRPELMSHVQSYVFCTDYPTLCILRKTRIFDSTNMYNTHEKTIQFKEIKMSRVLIQHGYNIGSLTSYCNDIDFTCRGSMPTIRQNPVLYMANIWNKLDKLFTKEDVCFIKGNRLDCIHALDANTKQTLFNIDPALLLTTG